MIIEELKENWNPKKTKYTIMLLTITIISTLAIIFLYIYYTSEIIASYNTIDGAFIVVLFLSIRIVIMGLLTSFIFVLWLKAEESYLTDIPFLMGIFFMTITFGKTIDLLHNLIHFSAPADEVLLIIKIRYFIIIGTVIPLLFFGLNMLLLFISLKENNNRLKDKSYRDKIRNITLIFIISVYCILLIYAPDYKFISILLPIIILPALTLTIWIFFVAYKNKRLTQVHPGILALGFTLYFISNITRPIMLIILGESALYIIYSEFFDICIFIIIFSGLILKTK